MKPPNFFFFLVFVQFTFLPPTYASQLSITVTSDVKFYAPGQPVNLHGNFTINGQLINSSLVALEITEPLFPHWPLLFRTLKTGPASGTPPGSWIRIKEAFFSDRDGNEIPPTVKPGSPLWIAVTINNLHTSLPQSVLIAVSIVDNRCVPIGSIPSGPVIIGPGEYGPFVLQLPPIPDWAALGDANAHVNLYTNWPTSSESPGYPYCPEEKVSFQIVDPPEATMGSWAISKTQNIQIQETQNGNGIYNMTFRIPPDEIEAGNYTVCVSAAYDGLQATNSTTFEVGISGDINHDGIVNYEDLFILARAYGTRKGDEEYKTDADLNGDEVINYKDLFVLAINYGQPL